MKCPRCHAVLTTETELGIEVDRCHTCNGRWLDHDELAQLEATTASTEADRRATIEYGERLGGLHCPICDKLMTAFDYRAYDLELDACPEHGYWLDAGEDGRIRDIINERVRDLNRSASAEAAWGGFLNDLRHHGRGLFGRRH